MDEKSADSGLWAKWTLWRWAGGDGGSRRSCRFPGTRNGHAGAWKQLYRNGAAPQARPASWGPGAVRIWPGRLEATSLQRGQTLARGHHVWGFLQTVEGAWPSRARDVLQENLDISATSRIGRRCESEKEDSSLGFKPPRGANVNLSRIDVGVHLLSHSGNPRPPRPASRTCHPQSLHLAGAREAPPAVSWSRRRPGVMEKCKTFTVKLPAFGLWNQIQM